MKFISHSIQETQDLAAKLLKDCIRYQVSGIRYQVSSVKDKKHDILTHDTLIPINVVCLYGDLGAGKTTFVQGLAKALGIKQRVISPTFVIVRQYQVSGIKYQVSGNKENNPDTITLDTLTHIDCYRLESEVDAKSFNLQEIWSDPKNLVIIEWAERIRHVLPKNRIDIEFKYIDERKREIEVVSGIKCQVSSGKGQKHDTLIHDT